MRTRLSARLNAAMREGNLNTSDLARWFNRPIPTVRGWVRGRYTRMTEYELGIVLDRLKLIERRIRLRAGLPVPQFTAHHRLRRDTQRIAYLNKLMARKKL